MDSNVTVFNYRGLVVVAAFLILIPVAAAADAGAGPQSVAVTVDGLAAFPPDGVPVRCGLPLGKGLVKDTSQVRLLDVAGKEVPVQAQPTGYWGDGSLKWLTLEFLARGRRYRAEIGAKSTARPKPPLKATETKEAITLVTGPMKLVVPKKGFRFPGQVWIDRNGDGTFAESEKVTDGGDAFVRLKGKITGLFRAANDKDVRVHLETKGPLRATLRIAGRYVDAKGAKADRWTIRIHAFAGSNFLQVQHTFVNDISLRQTDTIAVGLELPVGGLKDAQVLVGADGQRLTVPAAGRVVAARQVNAQKKAFPKFDQFKPELRILAAGKTLETRAKSDGYVVAKAADGLVVGAGLRDIWKKCPKELQIDAKAGAVRIYIVPDDGQGLDWLAGRVPAMVAPSGAGSEWLQLWKKGFAYGWDGIALTDEMILCFGGHAEQAAAQAKAFCAIPNAYADPKWLEETQALGCLPARDTKAFPDAERQLERMVEWIWRHQNEWFHWYGDVTYGGVQTHYQPHFGHWSDLTERYGWLGAEANTKAGVGLHYLRTGSRKAFELMRSMTRNNLDLATPQLPLDFRAGFGRRHFVVPWSGVGDWGHTFLFGAAICYHATGDERVRDVIELRAHRTLAKGPRGGTDRADHNRLRCALWMYEITHDARYRKLAERIMAETLRHQKPDGHFEYRGLFTSVYLLWAMELYDRMIGSEKVRESLVRLMDAYTTPGGLTRLGGTVWIYHKIWEGLAKAYRDTGNQRYLWPGIRDLSTVRYQSVYERYDPILRFPRSGYARLAPDGEVRPSSFVSMHDTGYRLAKIPYFLDALKRAGLTEAQYTKRIDTSTQGTFDPWTAEPGQIDHGRFAPVDLRSAVNTAPLAMNPFGGKANLTIAGLPWGATVAHRGVPYQLGRASGGKDKAVVCLGKAQSVRIPVGRKVAKLHFLGQVLARGDFEYGRPAGRYVIEFGDGTRKTVEWKNMVNCEDWRYLHYGASASLAQTWPPRLFDDVGDKYAYLNALVHVNTLAVDTEGKTVKQVVFDAGDSNAGPVLLAVTAELARPEKKPSPVRSIRFAAASRDPARAKVALAGKLVAKPQYLQSRPDAEGCTVTIPIPAGAYRVELLMSSSRPLSMDVRAGKEKVVAAWHLLGEWPSGPTRQRVSFNAATGGGGLALHFRAGRGHQAYRGNNYGGIAWNLGWGRDPKTKKWFGPTSEEFRTKLAPVWRLHEVKVWPAARAWRRPPAITVNAGL